MKIAFIGHRKIIVNKNLTDTLYKAIENLLKSHPDTEFLFGSKSEFDALCLHTVNQLKKHFPDLKRTYVRSSYKNIPPFYETYLNEIYDQTFLPKEADNAGKASYIKRNKAMIDLCDKLFVYYDPQYKVNARRGHSKNSGTKIAIEYAQKTKKDIVNFFNCETTLPLFQIDVP